MAERSDTDRAPETNQAALRLGQQLKERKDYSAISEDEGLVEPFRVDEAKKVAGLFLRDLEQGRDKAPLGEV